MNDTPLTQECLRSSVPGTGTKMKRISYRAYPGGVPLMVQPFHSGLRLLAATPANRPVMVTTPRLMKKPLPANAFDLRWTRAHQRWRHGGHSYFEESCWGHPSSPDFCLGESSRSSSTNPSGDSSTAYKTQIQKEGRQSTMNVKHLANKGLCWVIPGKGRRQSLGGSEL